MLLSALHPEAMAGSGGVLHSRRAVCAGRCARMWHVRARRPAHAARARGAWNLALFGIVGL